MIAWVMANVTLAPACVLEAGAEKCATSSLALTIAWVVENV
jgi:hypothetical protein